MFIYAITNDVNEKAYVGLHSGRDLRTRWCTHKSFSKRGSRSLISLAIRKHGIDKFHITAVWSGHVSIEKLKTLERYFIRSFGTKTPNGYNLTDGGDGTFGFRHSEEECRRRSERMSEQIRSGIIPSHAGQKRPAHVGLKISRAKTGKKRGSQTPEWRAKISASLVGNKRSLGWKMTPEQIAKRTASRSGYKHSEETKEKIRLSNIKTKRFRRAVKNL